MRRILWLIALMFLLSGVSVWADGIQVELNGNVVVMDSLTGMPYMDPSGRVMVPLRIVAEKAGKTVSFDTLNRMAIVSDGDKTVSIPVDKPYVIINREINSNDAPARIINGRTSLPIRIVMEAFGYRVVWDGSLSKVIIKGVSDEVSEPVIEMPAVYIPNTVGNTNINLYNGGLLARENDEFYFVNFEDEERIWHINLKSGAANRVSERAGRGINVVDDWVFYRQETLYNTWELFKTKKDGSETEMVATGNTQWLKVDSGYLYYYLSDEEALYRMKLTDLYGTKYYEQAMASINLENGWLVYVEMKEDSAGKEIPGDIIKVNIATRESKIVSSERSGTTEPLMAVIGKKAYFSRYNDALSLYKMDIESGETEKLNNRWTYNVTGDETDLFTLYPDYREGLYWIDPAVKLEKRLSDAWRPGTYHNPGVMLMDSKIYFLKKVTTFRYGWLCYDLVSGKLRSISEPADFLK